MQTYVFQPLENIPKSSSAAVLNPTQVKTESDPFMLQVTPFQARSLFTQQDLDQSYQAGYIDAKSTSLKELQQEAEFQKIESLKMITDYFPLFVQQNQEQCKIFCENVLHLTHKIITKLLPSDKLEKAAETIIRVFKELIDPLCQQEQLHIHLHPLMKDKVFDSITQAFGEKGQPVPLEFVVKKDFKVSQCEIYWPEGMVTIDQTAFEDNLKNLLTSHGIGEPAALQSFNS